MNIKYNKDKQVLREDPVVDSLLKIKGYISKNSNIMMGVIIIVLFILGVSMFYNNVRKSSQHKAQEAFGQALISYNGMQYDKAIEQFRIVVENHRSTPQSVFSSFLMGRILFDQGKYDEAITWFENAASSNNAAQFVGGEALEGIAACYENKGDTHRAIEYLEKALKDNRIKFRHSAIRWKMALLSRTKEPSRSRKLCQEIISDTTATLYHQQAENLMATISLSAG